ncbi:hypothetical protein GCM10008955_31350 [Deinococcus malanensis]|uniref:Response regulatory domain-containing protein n=1 Tax=Deinococcus malanensis TaxID=1706855 RepID=A0ABQ2EZI4_9DEIO|nr:hypothetical protein GCM10008955_31350 [Deinococcus malanensis]
MAACLEAGANDYLVKPLNFEEFTVCLRETLERWLFHPDGRVP